MAAVCNAAAQGVNFSRPSVWELRAAEDFLARVPGADMVKFAKNGSDTTTAAIKLARAVTGRDLVAICGTQPFFSFDDWFIASTQIKAGIPSAYGSMTVKFSYNDLDSLYALRCLPGRSRLLILEAATAAAEPHPGFLESFFPLQQHGTVLIFGGNNHRYAVVTSWRPRAVQIFPDLSTWGKALGNGFAVSALAETGSHEAGGLNTDASGSSCCQQPTAPELLVWRPILLSPLRTQNAM